MHHFGGLGSGSLSPNQICRITADAVMRLVYWRQGHEKTDNKNTRGRESGRGRGGGKETPLGKTAVRVITARRLVISVEPFEKERRSKGGRNPLLRQAAERLSPPPPEQAKAAKIDTPDLTEPSWIAGTDGNNTVAARGSPELWT